MVDSEPLLKPDPESPASPSQRGLVRKAFAVYLAAGAPAVMLAMELAAWLVMVENCGQKCLFWSKTHFFSDFFWVLYFGVLNFRP